MSVTSTPSFLWGSSLSTVSFDLVEELVQSSQRVFLRGGLSDPYDRSFCLWVRKGTFPTKLKYPGP